jgi:Ca2+-binding RTX toxin-like protein
VGVRARASVVSAAVILTWLVPSGAVAVQVAIGQPPSANTIFVTAVSGEVNALTITRDAGGYAVDEDGSATMTLGAGCAPGPSPNTATCPAAGISQVNITLGDLDDGVTVATPVNAVILGGTGNDALRSAGGQDVVRGQDGADAVIGGAGDDLLFGDDLSELDPGSGADQLDGGDGNDTLNGGRGPDTLLGGAGADVLQGGSDDDALDPGLGGAADNDTLVGDDGSDAVSYGLRSAPVVTTKDGVANDGQVGEADNIGSDVERVTGGLANDTVGGGSGADTLDGGPGDDTVTGFAGDDELYGDGAVSPGRDTIAGGPGNDRIHGDGDADALSGDDGNDIVEGGTGADTLTGGPGADQLIGGPGRDAVAYETAVNVTVRLDKGVGISRQPPDSDRIFGVEDASGGNRGDTLTGSREANALDGLRGEDYLDGGRGVDRLEGGPSADVVIARDNVRDEPVSCGPGRDLAIVDHRDRVARRGPNRCERVDNGVQTTPRPGWVYVHPDRCGSSAQGVELSLPAMHRLVPLRYSILLASGFRGRRAPTLDAADCPVRVRAAVGQGRRASADLSGGAVTVRQTSGRAVTTLLTVKPPDCAAGGRTAAVAREPHVRVRTDRRRGRWKVKGKRSTAAAVGTDWTTVEGCSRTVTVVRRGHVQVYDRVKRRTVNVGPGERYVAQGRRMSR